MNSSREKESKIGKRNKSYNLNLKLTCGILHQNIRALFKTENTYSKLFCKIN
jgi:hypothetical protein